MNREQALDAIRQKNGPEQFDCVLHLGAALTIAARDAYPQLHANIEHLVGFNEMQHRIFGWLQHQQGANNYPIEEMLNGLFTMAAHYGIEGALGWAVTKSLPSQS